MLTKVIDQSKIDHFAKWLERADKIVIVAHVAPDGDAEALLWGCGIFLIRRTRMRLSLFPMLFPIS